jgi:uncharacterized protein YbjT (DUF2867 family)
MSLIALTTPTGTVGSKVLRRLVEENAQVRVLARDASRIPQELAGKIEIVEGSLHEPADLARLMKGAEALFWCQPDPSTASDYLAAYRELAGKGRDAIRSSDVARVVAICAAGEKPKIPAGTVDGLYSIEEMLSQSGAACRFLRCASFMDNLLWQWEGILETGSFVYCMDGEQRQPHVATIDVARTAAHWLLRNDWRGVEPVQVLGPELLSYQEIAEILTRELQRPIVYGRMDAHEYRELMLSLGSSPSAADGLVAMFSYLEKGIAIPDDAPRADTPTTLAQWLQRDSVPA